MPRRLPKLYRKYEFTVTGSGSFPFDMLRYDSCYPTSGLDVTSMTFDPDVYDGGMSRSRERNVRLRSEREPTVARWESFGWRVEKIEGVG